MSKLSLKSRSILIVSTIIIFFGFFACFFVFIYSRQIFLNNETQAIQTLALEKAELNSVFFDQSKILLETIAEQESIKDYLNNDQSQQDPNILAQLQSYNLGDRYLAIYLLNTDGETLVSTDESLVGENYSFREYFQRSLMGEVYLDVVIGAISGELGYYFSHSVSNADGEIIGVVVADLDPKSVEEGVHLKDGLAKHGSNVFLVNKFGVIVYSNKEDAILHSLGKMGSETHRLLKDTKYFGSQDIQALSYDKVQDDLVSSNDRGTFQFYDERDQAEEVLALAKISDYPFFILIEKEADVFLRQAYGIAWKLAIFVGVATIFSMIFIFFFIRNIFKPLARLQEGLVLASKGDFDQQIVVSSDDELEDLGDSFNALIRELKKNKELVEKMVIEKTKNLEKLNQNTVERELKMIALKKELSDLKKKK